ncbi:MAG: PhzF family phenazine biosynthesis protein [Gemmatimonadota bacterium]|nr:MAG: PhzF family phenazine biosynthesis protein [Gemmatimonadota bacterium]
MNSQPKFFFTDVFSQGKYSGNQLATFTHCASLSDEEMQRIAREINFSETTFILSDEPQDGGYNVRIFTPMAEIDFAGHPTLGTAYIIRKHIMQQPVNRVVLNLKVGQVPVEFPEGNGDGTLWMKQAEPTFGKIMDVEPMAKVLSLKEDDIDVRWPIEEVSTGLPFIVVPLTSLDALKRVSIRRELYDELIRESWAKIILTFCPEGYSEGQEFGVRVFPICLGISEDPATGSGNGCLAAYLVKNRYLKSDRIDLATGQGYEIGRPSHISLRAQGRDEGLEIFVGGKVVPIAEGRWG